MTASGRPVSPWFISRERNSMAMTAGQLSDRMEIMDTATLYAYAVDHRDWSLWDRVFTLNASLDYAEYGLGVLNPAQWRERLVQMDSEIIAAQHLLSNWLVELDGDSATSRVEYHYYGSFRSERAGVARFSEGGCLYLDELVRTSGGWRISHRRAIEKWSRKSELECDSALAIERHWGNSPREIMRWISANRQTAQRPESCLE